MKFLTKDGWLTPYALTYGYRHEQRDGALLLYIESGGYPFYTVYVTEEYWPVERLRRMFDESKLTHNGHGTRIAFTRIDLARSAFRRLCRQGMTKRIPETLAEKESGCQWIIE